LNDRIKIFEVKRDEEKIKKVYERVLLAREYLKSITATPKKEENRKAEEEK